jgi:nitrogen fixation protein FixH
MTKVDKPQRELTGRHVLIALLAFFGVIIAINGYFITMAVLSFRGEDVKRSYLQGVEYNQRIEARAGEYALGWSVKGNVTDGGDPELIFELSDKAGKPIIDAVVSGVLRHPTDRDLDKAITLAAEGNGRYRASLISDNGARRFMGTAKKNDDVFVFQYDVNSGS